MGARAAADVIQLYGKEFTIEQIERLDVSFRLERGAQSYALMPPAMTPMIRVVR
jgi:hypothetical protein